MLNVWETSVFLDFPQAFTVFYQILTAFV